MGEQMSIRFAPFAQAIRPVTRAPAASKFVAEIVAKLTDPDASVRRLAAEALGAIGPAAKSALPQLVEIVGNGAEDLGVRSAAEQAALRIAKLLKQDR